MGWDRAAGRVVGCYLSGHVYDDIAPKLTDQFHVYAVTRRGVGNSDQPPAGYDPQRRAADILEVMTALGIRMPILVGNSCGGGILHTLGAERPDRIGALMYQNPAVSPTADISATSTNKTVGLRAPWLAPAT